MNIKPVQVYECKGCYQVIAISNDAVICPSCKRTDINLITDGALFYSVPVPSKPTEYTPELPPILGVKEVKDYLGISISNAYDLMKGSDFPLLNIGGRTYRVKRDDFYEWLDTRYAIPGEDPLLKVEDLSDILGKSKWSTYEIMNRKGFPKIKIGRSLRVRKSEFEEWLSNQKV